MIGRIISAAHEQRNSLLNKLWYLWSGILAAALAISFAPAIFELPSAIAYAENSDTEIMSVVTVHVIGVDADGNPEDWVPTVRKFVPIGSNAGEATVEALEEAGLKANVIWGDYGGFLSSITGPDGNDYGYKDGNWWNFLVNGEMARTGAWSHVVQPGDEITWYYSTGNKPLPSEFTPEDEPITYDANVVGPDWESEWPGFADTVETPQGSNIGAVITANTPSTCATTKWEFDSTKGTTGWVTSDPLLVEDSVYISHGDKFFRIDKETGAVLASSNLYTITDYTLRPIYANGFIYMPLANGRIQAFSADTLQTAWVSQPLGHEDTQGSTSLKYDNGVVYTGITDTTETWEYIDGLFAAVDAATGKILWRTQTQPHAGFYWNGALIQEDRIIITDTQGIVHVFDKATGKETQALDLKAENFSDTLGNAANDTAYVATKDGILHVLDVSGEVPTQTKSIKFADENASTPAIADNKAFILARTTQQDGQLVIVDLESDEVTTINAADGKKMPRLNATPLVVKRSDGTYVYFISNEEQVRVFVYKVGDSEAKTLYTTEASKSYFGDSPLIADKNGTIYYLNDTGWLFALEEATATVTYKDADGSTLQESIEFSPCDTEPAYMGEVPSKAEDDDFTYAFSGWKKTTDDRGNITYTAEYKATSKHQEADKNADDQEKESNSDEQDTNGSAAGAKASEKSKAPAEPYVTAPQAPNVLAKTGDTTDKALMFAAVFAIVAVLTARRAYRRVRND